MDTVKLAESNFTAFETLLWNFYIIDREKTTFEHTNQVPNYANPALPIFVALIVLEYLFYLFKYGKGFSLSDGITSVGLGLIMESSKLITKGFEVMGYQWLYQYRILDLDWTSPWTWWAAALGADLGHYVVHRAAHEISFFWCGHQVHHSSEEYNLTTALRQSAFQRFFYFGFYHPLALLGVPLPALLVHMQFNLLAQFVLHSQLIPNLGPLEWVMNTATHHRIHHGINKWCLDKNYGGFLIIWDRLFGTFQPMRYDEPIVYGLVSQPQTMEPLYLQVFYFKLVIEKALSQKTRKDFWKALVFGPGWTSGSPRLGDEHGIPDKTPLRKKYTPNVSKYMEMYVVLHFLVVLFAQQMLAVNYAMLSWKTVLTFMFFLYLSFFTLGSFYDGIWWAPVVEAVRCLGTVYVLNSPLPLADPRLNLALQIYFGVSTFMWAAQSVMLVTSQDSSDLKDIKKQK